MKEMEAGLVEAGNIWFNHKIGTVYIGPDSEKMKDHYWVKGMVKIQQVCIDDKTLNEIEACKYPKSESASIKMTL